ncbi:MAG TPA: MEDS domain-containing protein, partial [Polyangiaceae bacterium]|nr:MEDS domain-containing protein [Polyangiaceae bacterium]
MGERAAAHEVSRHKCLIYDGDPAEQLPVVVPLLREGLSDNWRCLYLGSPDAVQMVDAALTAKGVDTGREIARKALLLSSDRSHLKDGRFDPGTMVDGLRSAIDDSLRDGFHGLCATGDMRWELGADENFDHLLEYEARLEQVFREMPLRGVCQYHRRMVPAQAVQDALVTHRSTYLGSRLNQDNLFYVPPELLLEAREGGDAKYAEWMCQQISRVMDAERARDEVLRDLERRVAERTAELNVANRQLRAFSYSVSHDLRAPLRAINGFGAVLAEEAGEQLSPESRAHLGHILTATKEMGELIEGMLILGRVVESEMQRAPVDLGKIARDVAGGLRASEPNRTIELVVHDGLTAIGDPALLRAMMTNLLGNAWKFTARRANPRIEVGRRTTADGFAFFVRDNGAGFDMQYAHKLFGAFQRLHSRTEFAGTGVGLATVERIVSRHGGQIWAEG